MDWCEVKSKSLANVTQDYLPPVSVFLHLTLGFSEMSVTFFPLETSFIRCLLKIWNKVKIEKYPYHMKGFFFLL